MKKRSYSPPLKYHAVKRDYPEIIKAYEKLGAACHKQGPLSAKTRELVKIGIAIGAGLESATKAHVRVALDVGASPAEIKHTVLLATTTIGFPSMMRGMTWIGDVLEAPERT